MWQFELVWPCNLNSPATGIWTRWTWQFELNRYRNLNSSKKNKLRGLRKLVENRGSQKLCFRSLVINRRFVYGSPWPVLVPTAILVRTDVVLPKSGCPVNCDFSFYHNNHNVLCTAVQHHHDDDSGLIFTAIKRFLTSPLSSALVREMSQAPLPLHHHIWHNSKRFGFVCVMF